MATKKELEIVNTPNSTLFALRFKGGGELPDALKSGYTSNKEAAKMRDLYYAGNLPKTIHQTYQSIKKAEKTKVA